MRADAKLYKPYKFQLNVLCSLAASHFFALQRGGAAGEPAAAPSMAVSSA